jgi:hypothetical protein
MRVSLRRALLTVVAALMAGLITAAYADRGVSLDVGKIEINQRLSRGGEYQLPAVGVRNPGTEVTRYRMGVAYIDDQDGRRPPESWFAFSPAELELAPGETKPVKVELQVPTGARPDDYEALIQAEIAAEGEGTTVGAAAAARLSFTVKPSNLLQAWQLEAQDFLHEKSPWSYLVPGAVGLGLVGWWLRKRFTLSVGRRA